MGNVGRLWWKEETSVENREKCEQRHSKCKAIARQAAHQGTHGIISMKHMQPSLDPVLQ